MWPLLVKQCFYCRILQLQSEVPHALRGNKKRRKIAALLALTLCRLCGSHWPAPPELRDELYQATAATVLRPPLRPGVAVSASIPVAGQQEHDWPDWQDWRRSRREDWLPLSGSWVWWSSDILVVLCEDVSAQIFADARTWFYEVAEVQQEPEEQRAPRELNQRTQQIFPDIFFTSLFRHQTHAVVGVGRDLEHRKRAGSLGLAARISRGSLCLTRVQGQVVDEVFQSPWLPQEPIQRFFDLENHGFWQNIEIWQESEEHKVAPLTKKNLSDIRMNCQPALLRTLEECRLTRMCWSKRCLQFLVCPRPSIHVWNGCSNLHLPRLCPRVILHRLT